MKIIKLKEEPKLVHECYDNLFNINGYMMTGLNTFFKVLIEHENPNYMFIDIQGCINLLLSKKDWNLTLYEYNGSYYTNVGLDEIKADMKEAVKFEPNPIFYSIVKEYYHK